MWRFLFSNQFAQMARNMAKGSFITGLLLIGFGMLVFVLRDLFALLAAGLFFLAGLSAIGYAIKLWLTTYRMNRATRDSRHAHRENVRIHGEEDLES